MKKINEAILSKSDEDECTLHWLTESGSVSRGEGISVEARRMGRQTADALEEESKQI